ncbi:hypothetical protein BpHYR1_032136 [Brachionus plicatilis]|uniref:Uncharacterized protein n=1 Tax=Brachionus plicatilis TaxID=10195 RepID=A0A3M7QMS2_BRAPC|nr:hypothetical protein BpHYR1_032136 [Brachionus plicatilis]
MNLIFFRTESKAGSLATWYDIQTLRAKIGLDILQEIESRNRSAMLVSDHESVITKTLKNNYLC